MDNFSKEYKEAVQRIYELIESGEVKIIDHRENNIIEFPVKKGCGE